MIGVAIMYIILSLPYFLRKYLEIEFSFFAKKIYLSLFFSGVFNLFISIVNFIFPHFIWKILFGLSILFLCYICLSSFNKWRDTIEVTQKLEKSKLFIKR